MNALHYYLLKHTRDIEGVLCELRNSFEEKKDHTHVFIRPDHKDSKVLGQKMNKRAVLKGNRDSNRNK